MIVNYPKATVVAARGTCHGAASAIFSSFDIRIVAENFHIRDGDIFSGALGSWGISSLRLPIWIGRNRILDYMLLNEEIDGQRAYEMGIVSKVISNDQLDSVGLQIAKKISKAAPIAVQYYKECVHAATEANLELAKKFVVNASQIVRQTEDCKRGLATMIEDPSAPMCDFYGR